MRAAESDRLTLRPLTEENLPQAREIRREDVSEDFVDGIDTLWELTQYGLEHGCVGRSFAVYCDEDCIGVLLLGEALPWETDPPEMAREPFYRLMGFVLDRRYRGFGLGGRVLEMAVEAVYEEFGVRPVALGVHRGNVGAERFYLRHGFRKTEAMDGEDYYYLRYPKTDS